ncbi:MAG: glycosyltransferase family 2 protein, partial [Silicimonas sp.]|nr:glycosyltransferase family 2 protein [Silicimonas sp.]
MSVLRRRIEAARFEDQPVLGAVRCAQGVLVAFSKEVAKEPLYGLERIETGRGCLAFVPDGTVNKVAEAELDLFFARRVMVALRNGETAEAAADWVRYHSVRFQVDGALIFNRTKPGSDEFADNLKGLLSEADVTVVVVDADTPVGRKGAPDARNPSLAPAVSANVRGTPANPWHAPLGELTVYELLRHRFLASAQSVALLDVSDFLMPQAASAFDLAEQNPGHAISLVGTETYPWRLRRGHAAPFADHIAKRRAEARRLLSWSASPSTLPEACIWQPGRPLAVPASKQKAMFSRAMGVMFPGAPVESIVKKADLVEDQALVALSKSLGHAPVRLPAAAVIPSRPQNGKVTIVSVMKNEGPFILDWIAHNRAIGVDRFLIYSNDCADGTDRMLTLLAEAGVTHRDNPYRTTGQVPQYAAFRAAEREEVVTSADWLLTLDVDEYINVHVGDGRLRDLFDVVPEAHLISMPWRLFGGAGVHSFEDVPVTHQFTKAAPAFMPRPYQAWAFKTLYRNAGLFRRLGVHRPKGLQPAFRDSILWVTGSGKPLPSETWRSAWRVGMANWGYDLVTLNHYAVRSAESFLIKRDRGRVNHV